MRQHVLAVALVAALVPPVAAQQPPLPPPAVEPAFDADAVAEEVRAFYADYWKAWDERDAEHLGVCLAPEFIALQHVSPAGVVQLDKAAALSSIRQFFDVVRGRDTAWRRSLLSIIPRSPEEAVAAVRNDFSLGEGGGEIELTLEVLRKGADGRWRLLRKWTEKSPF